MSLTEHPLWGAVRPYIQWDIDKKTKDAKEPRYRFWMRTGLSRLLKGWLHRVEMPCVKCGRPMHPFRGSHFAVSCPQRISLTCSRSPEAKREYVRIAREVAA